MEGYSTIEQVAKHYQVSISTVRSWIRAKRIPFLKVGGMYRFKMLEVDAAFLLQTEQQNVAPAVEQGTTAIPVATSNLDQDA